MVPTVACPGCHVPCRHSATIVRRDGAWIAYVCADHDTVFWAPRIHSAHPPLVCQATEDQHTVVARERWCTHTPTGYGAHFYDALTLRLLHVCGGGCPCGWSMGRVRSWHTTPVTLGMPTAQDFARAVVDTVAARDDDVDMNTYYGMGRHGDIFLQQICVHKSECLPPVFALIADGKRRFAISKNKVYAQHSDDYDAWVSRVEDLVHPYGIGCTVSMGDGCCIICRRVLIENMHMVRCRVHLVWIDR